MATIVDICFLDLPINNSYENVYDSKEKIIALARGSSTVFKKAKFNLEDRNLGFNLNKKTQLTLLKSNFTESISNLSFFNAFNYCIIRMKEPPIEQDVMYFINSRVLNNSNDVVTFNLEFDEWHNNVDEFYQKNRNREQIFERLTYDGFTKKIDGDKVYYSYNGFIRDEPIKVRNKYIEEADARVLFKKIIVREENTAYLYFDEPIAAKSSSNSAYSLLTNLNVYYIPICVTTLNGINKEVEYIEYSPIQGGENKKVKMLLFQDKNSSMESGESFLDTITVSSELTYNSPYRYIIGNSTVLIEDPVLASNIIGRNKDPDLTNPSSHITLGFIVFGATNVEDFIDGDALVSENYNFYKNINVNFFNANLKKDLIGRFNYYPFNYKAFKINGIEYPFIPNYQTKKTFELHSGYDYFSPILKVKENNFTMNPIPIVPSSKTPVVNDSYSNFLISGVDTLNNQRLYSQISNAISTVSSAATLAGGVMSANPIMTASGLASFGNSILNISKTEDGYNTKIKETDNALDGVRDVTNNGFNNIFEQDRIIKKQYVILDVEQRNMVINFFDRYGITFNSFADFEPQHHKFDYYKSTSADLIIANLESLNKIKVMFSNGIRIWHLSNFNDTSSDKFADCLNLSYTNTNVPMSIIEGEGIIL